MHIKALSDKDRIAISSARDESAFKRFFVSNFSALRDYAYLFLKDRHTAEDVASEVMWKIWHLESDLMHIAKLEHYMLRAVKNRCLNLARIARVVCTTDEDLEFKDDRLDICSPEHILIQNEAVNRIYCAIDLLPEKTKQVFKYVKEDKISYKETALKMDISIKTVDRHIQIAVKKLWAALKK